MQLLILLNFLKLFNLTLSVICIKTSVIDALHSPFDRLFSYEKPSEFKNESDLYDMERVYLGIDLDKISGPFNVGKTRYSSEYPKRRKLNKAPARAPPRAPVLARAPFKGEVSFKKDLEDGIKNPLNEADYTNIKNVPGVAVLFGHENDGCLDDPQLFEGDIKIQLPVNSVIKIPTNIWPGGRIPYVIKNSFTKESRSVIADAIRDFNSATCVKFIQATSSDLSKSFVYIFPGDRCHTNQVGFKPSIKNQGAMVEVSVGKGCHRVAIVQHLLMHVLGFWHEQNRPDRDKYVRINWKNIKLGKEQYFKKNSAINSQIITNPYDYQSIMHFHDFMFAKGKEPTIVPTQKKVEIVLIPAMSVTDVKKINKLYGCDKLKDDKKKSGTNPCAPKKCLWLTKEDSEGAKNIRFVHVPGSLDKES